MNYLLVLNILAISLLSFVSVAKSNHPVITKYCASNVFRETPFSDIRCAKEIPQTEANNIRHFQYDYNKNNQLVEVRYMLHGKLQPYSDRFLRAPRTTIEYQDGKELRRYYNSMNLPTVVSGHVYRSEFILDDHGNRLSLTFFDIHNQPVANNFDIASYQWQQLDNGDVIEQRFDLQGSLQRNRPGFGYLITRFSWDAKGLLARMYNLGSEGLTNTPDKAGIVMTEIDYSNQGQFTKWLNLNASGVPQRGMSNIAEIRYQPSSFRGEAEAWFFDANGQPQTTNWGAHRVSYKFDNYGNETQIRYFDVDDKPVNVNSGLAKVINQWSKDGTKLLNSAYYDKTNSPVASKSSGVHRIAYQYDELGRPTNEAYFNLANKPIVDKNRGYARHTITYTDYVTQEQYFNEKNQPVNNIHGYSTSKIHRDKNKQITQIEYINSNGESVNVVHSAAH